MNRRKFIAAFASAIAGVPLLGRLVLPKSIREETGILPGMPLEVVVNNGTVEISPAPRQVRIVSKGRLEVAEPADEGPRLTVEQVRTAQRAARRRG